jgi:hypothetical protein
MWEGTTWRIMAADRPYGEFYDFYGVSPEYFGYTVVCNDMLNKNHAASTFDAITHHASHIHESDILENQGRTLLPCVPSLFVISPKRLQLYMLALTWLSYPRGNYGKSTARKAKVCPIAGPESPEGQ